MLGPYCFGGDENRELKEGLRACLGLRAGSKLKRGSDLTAGAPGGQAWGPSAPPVSWAGGHVAPLRWEGLQQTLLSGVFVGFVLDYFFALAQASDTLSQLAS